MSLSGNIRQAVPFLRIADMEASLRFYVDRLGFEMKNRWTIEGRIRWCWEETQYSDETPRERCP